MYAITTQLRFFHNNSPGAERFLGTPHFWGIFDLGTDGNLCRQGSDLFLDFCEKQPYSINIITITVIERYERKKTMSTLKYSRQRESIKVCLQGRKDHPTADMLYTDVRKEFPNISLGTVYRNLSLLSELGEASYNRRWPGPVRWRYFHASPFHLQKMSLRDRPYNAWHQRNQERSSGKFQRYDRRLLCEFLRHLRELQKSPGERIASPGRKKKLKIGIDKKGSLC